MQWRQTKQYKRPETEKGVRCVCMCGCNSEPNPNTDPYTVTMFLWVLEYYSQIPLKYPKEGESSYCTKWGTPRQHVCHFKPQLLIRVGQKSNVRHIWSHIKQKLRKTSKEIILVLRLKPWYYFCHWNIIFSMFPFSLAWVEMLGNSVTAKWEGNGVLMWKRWK